MRPIILLTLLLLIAAGGCRTAASDAVTPGLVPPPALVDGPRDVARAHATAGGASLRGSHDRRHWPHRTVRLEVGRTAHPRRYGAWIDPELPPAARRAEHPDPASALRYDELPHPTLDATGRLVTGLAGLLLVPVELVVRPPFETASSPADPYRRVPVQPVPADDALLDAWGQRSASTIPPAQATDLPAQIAPPDDPPVDAADRSDAR